MSAADSAAGAAGGEAALAPSVRSSVASKVISVADSGVPLDPDAVAQHAKDLLAGRVPFAGYSSLDTPVAALGQATGGPAAWEAVLTPGLLGCYEKLVTSFGAVLAIDRVSYRGRDAVLVVLEIQDTSDITDESGTSATSSDDEPAGQGGAAAAAPGTVPPGQDRIQLTVVDLGCDAGHLADDTWYAGTTTKA